jgi:transposase
MAKEGSAEDTIRTIKRKTRRKYSVEEKIRIVLEGLHGEDSIAALCRREGIAQSLYYKWSKAFLEGGQGRDATLLLWAVRRSPNSSLYGVTK